MKKIIWAIKISLRLRQLQTKSSMIWLRSRATLWRPWDKIMTVIRLLSALSSRPASSILMSILARMSKLLTLTVNSFASTWKKTTTPSLCADRATTRKATLKWQLFASTRTVQTTLVASASCATRKITTTKRTWLVNKNDEDKWTNSIKMHSKTNYCTAQYLKDEYFRSSQIFRF